MVATARPSPYLRVRRFVGRNVFGLPFDATLGWTHDRPPDIPGIDVVRIGACESRMANLSHTVNSPIGYPRLIVESLARHGVGIGWQSLWAWNLEDFPTTSAELVKRRRRSRRPPDLLLLQVGGFHSIRHVLGFSPRVLGLRENGGRWLGPAIRPAWRLLSLWLQLVGRIPPYPGTAQLERFVDLVRETWPDTEIAMQELLEPALAGMLDRERLEWINADLRAVAARKGLGWIPRPALGRDMSLRCANGINLNERGTQIAAAHYADWILENVTPQPPRS